MQKATPTEEEAIKRVVARTLKPCYSKEDLQREIDRTEEKARFLFS